MQIDKSPSPIVAAQQDGGLVGRLEIAAQWDDSPSQLLHEAIAALAEKDARIAELEAQVAKATDPAYLTEALEKIGVCDVAELTASRAECEGLRAALEPFAHIGTNFDQEDGWSPSDKFTITYEDRRLAEIDLSCFYGARAALCQKDETHA